jgi:hypothetical protein
MQRMMHFVAIHWNLALTGMIKPIVSNQDQGSG